ncbi:hypothetical protein B0T16DRAFT_461821 [Cercophora newfieldiana]|uniref:Uncharacterized protein n=1 Tax=Cercophora newfieldiana TaxID=92897 RepID=A0AA39XZD9_9PEZI|nr:hypothetical protein B0T16DRAFT_461821 [Cercophora newfieldiana]
MLGRAGWLALTSGSLAVAQSDVRDQRTGNWTTISCEHPMMVNAENFTGAERWGVLDADHAWADILTAWRTAFYTDMGLDFQTAVFHQLSTYSGTSCGKAWAVGGCKQVMSCEDRFDWSGAASSLIMNSFVVVHTMFSHLFNALADLANADLRNFGVDFGILSDTETKSTDGEIARIAPVLLDMIPLASLVALAPTFNISIDQNPYFTPSPAVRKSIVMEILSVMAPIVQERMKSTNASDNVWGWTYTQDIQRGYLNPLYVHHAWQNLTSDAGVALFSGSEDSIKHLTNLISDGKMLALNRSTDNPRGDLIPETPASGRARRDAVLRGMYAFGIPAGWTANSAGVFVFESGIDCGSKDRLPLMSDFINIPSTVMTQETANATASCHNGKMYFLVSANRNGQAFSAPKGIEKLDTDQYGKLSRHDIIQGAIRTYESNGNKNGAPKINPTDPAMLSTIYDEGVLTPRYIRLAVCGGDEVARNRGSNGYSTYPCDRVGQENGGLSSFGTLGRGVWWSALMGSLFWIL